jgi:hypothetical protein
MWRYYIPDLKKIADNANVICDEWNNIRKGTIILYLKNDMEHPQGKETMFYGYF